MRKDTLDFSQTCPEIDDRKRDTDDLIHNNVQGAMDEYAEVVKSDEYLPKDEKDALESISHNYTERIFDGVQDNFEKVRSLNADMRKRADEQIEELSQERDELEKERDELERELNKAKDDAQDAERRVEELEDQLNEKESA